MNTHLKGSEIMEFETYVKINRLQNFLQYNTKTSKFKLSTPESVVFFPFRTRTDERPKFRNGFKGVVGETIRQVFGMNSEADYSSFIAYAQKIVKFESDVNEFIEILSESSIRDINFIQNPKVMAFLKLADKNEGLIGEREIAKFINYTLLEDDDILVQFLESSSDRKGNVLTRLQVDYLKSESINPIERNTENIYQNYQVIQMFMEDLTKITKDIQIFIKYFELFLNYYYVFYISQLTVDLVTSNKVKGQNYKFYFFLDWETAGKNRDGYRNGFGRLKEFTKDIYAHINATEHINILFDQIKSTVSDIYIKMDDIEDYDVSLNALKEWISLFRKSRSLIDRPSIENKNLEELYRIYVDDLNKSFESSPGAESRYSKSIEEAYKTFFLKSRGSLGSCLNISHDFLMLLVYLSTETRTSIVDLFRNFEKRGVFLDKYSKDEVVRYLTKLNFIDKKSDSGEAQYVKSIL